jgi:hypothetical protein
VDFRRVADTGKLAQLARGVILLRRQIVRDLVE